MKVIIMTDDQYESGKESIDQLLGEELVTEMISKNEGEYCVLYQNEQNSMIHRHGGLEVGKAYGKFNFVSGVALPTYDGDIKPNTETFKEVAHKLKKAYSELLRHINPDRILFTADYEWTPSKSTHNSNWKADIKKVDAKTHNILDYDFELKFHWYYLEELHRTQIYALMLSYFLQIDPEKKTVKKMFVDDQNPVTVTFGTDVFEPRNAMERDIIAQPLKDDEWATGQSQITLFEQFKEDKQEE